MMTDLSFLVELSFNRHSVWLLFSSCAAKGVVQFKSLVTGLNVLFNIANYSLDTELDTLLITYSCNLGNNLIFKMFI